MRNLITNLIIISFLISSCAKPITTGVVEVEMEQFSIQNLYFDNPEKDYIYKAKLDVFKHEFGGILIIKKIEEAHFRVVYTTEFGNKIFDFEWINNDFRVNQILSDLDKDFIINLLRNDLQLLIARDVEIEKQFENNGKTIFQSTVKEGYVNYYSFDKHWSHLIEIVQTKRNKKKVTLEFSQIQMNQSIHINIHHHNFNMNLELVFIGNK